MQCENPDLGVVRHLLSALFSMVASEINDTIEGTDSLNSKNTTLQCFLNIGRELPKAFGGGILC